MKESYKSRIFIAFLIFFLFAIMAFSLFMGRYEVHTLDDIGSMVLFKLRLPRILAAVFIGGYLAVSGVTFQGIFANPLVSPDLLGSSAGAGLGACIAIMINGNILVTQLFAFAGGLIATCVTCFLGNLLLKGRRGIVVYVLIGMVVTSVLNAGISIAKYVSDPYSDLQTITFWLMGSLTKVRITDFYMLVLVFFIGFFFIFINRWKINLLSFREDEAKSMGIDTRRIRYTLIAASTLLCSTSVAIGGTIGWVGLVVPHMARMMVGPDSRRLVVVSFLLGGCYLLLIDDISRTFLSIEIPIGIITSVIGAPIFIILLLRGRNGWK